MTPEPLPLQPTQSQYTSCFLHPSAIRNVEIFSCNEDFYRSQEHMTSNHTLKSSVDYCDLGKIRKACQNGQSRNWASDFPRFWSKHVSPKYLNSSMTEDEYCLLNSQTSSYSTKTGKKLLSGCTMNRRIPIEAAWNLVATSSAVWSNFSLDCLIT